MKGSAFETEAESQRSVKVTPPGVGVAGRYRRNHSRHLFFLCFFNGMYLSRYENISYTEIRNQRVAIKDRVLSAWK